MSGMEHEPNVLTDRQFQIGSLLAGILTLTGLAFFTFSALITVVFQGGAMGISDKVLLPATGLMFILNAIGFVLIRKQKSMLGVWLVFIISMIMVPVLTSLTLKNTYALTALTTIFFTYAFRVYVFPKSAGQRAVIVAGIALLLILGIEVWNPAFRETSDFNVPSVGAGIMALAFLGLISYFVRRALSGNIRSKITAGILLTGLVSVGVLTFFAFNRAGTLISTLSNRLETNVSQLAEEQLLNRVTAEANSANQYFEEIASQARDLAEYTASVQRQQNVLDQGTYWNAEEKLTLLDGGKYGNPTSDVSSVFVPSTVALDNTVMADLNTTAYLDFSAPQVLKGNPDILAIYYIDKTNVVRYYPNVNLASLLPPDFDATSRPYFKITAPLFNPQKNTRWTIPYVDAAGGGLVVTVAAPVYLEDDFRGVVAADLQLTTLTNQVSAIKAGQTGYAFILDDSGHIISMPPAGYELFELNPNDYSPEEFFNQTVHGRGSVELESIVNRMVAGSTGLVIIPLNGVDTYITYARVPSNNYSLAVVVPVSEMQTVIEAARSETEQQTRSAIQTTALILAALFIGATIVSVSLGQVIAAPILSLTQTANKILEGDLGAQANVTTTDEIGTLARAFNAMTSRLSETLIGLEKTVENRTAELVAANEKNERRARQFEAIAQVARSITSTQNFEILLPKITNLISREFGFYHAGIFLLDTRKEFAVLSAANSEGGQRMLERNHSLRVGETGIVGYVTSAGKARVALDTGTDAVFFNNPDLPETRSEIALPLRIGDEIIGALDVQSTESNAFNEEDINVLGTLADQVSIAIQNARQFEATRKALTESEILSRQFVQSGWQSFTKSRDLVGIRHTGVKATLLYGKNKKSKSDGPDTSNRDQARAKTRGASLSLPIKLRGEVIGSVDVRSPANRPFDQDELDIVTAIIERAAIAMENARLLAESQKRAAKERTIGEISAKISAQSDIDDLLKTAAQELNRTLPGTEIAIQFKKEETE